jgi:hypothetical protein
MTPNLAHSSAPEDGGSALLRKVNFYQTTRRHIPEGSILHTKRCENLASKSQPLISS